MLGGAIVGGLSGGIAGKIAASGKAFSHTLSIAAGSSINSVGTFIYTGGQTDLSVSFGAFSYNLTQNEWGYLGKEGNSLLENIGYAFGAMANIQDAFAGFKGGAVDVKSRKKLAGHSWIEGEDINISVGSDPGIDIKPNANGLKWESQFLLRKVKGTNFITPYKSNEVFSTKLRNVNVTKLKQFTKNLNSGLSLDGGKALLYGFKDGCVNYTSNAL